MCEWTSTYTYWFWIRFDQWNIARKNDNQKTLSMANLTWQQSLHYSDVIMSSMASQTTGVPVVCLTVCSCTHQRKLSFVREIHRSSVDSPHKGSVTRKIFPFDDVIVNWWRGMWGMAPYNVSVLGKSDALNFQCFSLSSCCCLNRVFVFGWYAFYMWTDFTLRPFRPKGYCGCLRPSVHPSVTLPYPHDNSSRIWARITKWPVGIPTDLNTSLTFPLHNPNGEQTICS